MIPGYCWALMLASGAIFLGWLLAPAQTFAGLTPRPRLELGTSRPEAGRSAIELAGKPANDRIIPERERQLREMLTWPEVKV